MPGVPAPVFILPIFNKVTPLHDPKVTEPVLRLAHASGIQTNDVYEMDASKQTTAPTSPAQSHRAGVEDQLSTAGQAQAQALDIDHRDIRRTVAIKVHRHRSGRGRWRRSFHARWRCGGRACHVHREDGDSPQKRPHRGEIFDLAIVAHQQLKCPRA